MREVMNNIYMCKELSVANLALLDLLEEQLLPLVLAGGVLESGQLHQLPVARDVEARRALPPLLRR